MRRAVVVTLLCVVCASATELELIRSFNQTSLFREKAFGVPVVVGGGLEEVFKGVGYAHATERLWQIFLRYAAAHGRLAEFMQSDANIQQDMREREQMYTDSEIQEQFLRLPPFVRIVHQGFSKGLLARVDEINSNPHMLPFEFKRFGMTRVPTDLFDDLGVIKYTLYTMRKLADGHEPTGQLTYFTLLNDLRDRFPDTAQDMFDDLVTTEKTYPPETVVAPDGSEKSPSGRPARPFAPAPPLRPEHVAMAKNKLAEDKQLDSHLLDMGVLTKDGSWAIAIGANRSASGRVMLQAGPQDPNPFPAQFLEIFIESAEAQITAHYFTEPGSPINQIYGTFGNFSAARNRGYLLANDFLFEDLNTTKLSHTDSIRLQNGSTVDFPVYRSFDENGWRGFVLQRNETAQQALTLRSVFFGREMQGLTFLISMFYVRNSTAYAQLVSNGAVQSHIHHSHLVFVDSQNNIGASMPGLWTSLPEDIDRRLPQGLDGTVPEYTYAEVVRTGPIDMNHRQGYYAVWNTPFNTTLPYFRTFGGLWRSQWFIDYIEKNATISFSELQDIIIHAVRAQTLRHGGGNGDYDSFPSMFQSTFARFVEEDPTRERLEAMQILEGYDGRWLRGPADADVRSEFMLANAWLYRVVNATFFPYISTGPFAMPPVSSRGVLPNITGTQRRIVRMMERLVLRGGNGDMRFDWLQGRNLSDLVLSALDRTLEVLDPGRNWGVNQRSLVAMSGVGGVLGPVKFVLGGQLPSLNMAVEHGTCGPNGMASSVPFGVSGSVTEGETGLPKFDVHANDQFPLYTAYRYRPLFMKFNATLICLDKNHGSSDVPVIAYVLGFIAILILVAVVGLCCKGLVHSRNEGEGAQFMYSKIAGQSTMSTMSFKQDP